MQKGSHSAELREDIKRIFSLLKRYFQLPTHFQNVYFFWGNFGPKIFSEIFKLKWTMLPPTWPFLASLLLDITIYIQDHFDHITLYSLNIQVRSGDLNFFFHFKTAGDVICIQKTFSFSDLIHYNVLLLAQKHIIYTHPCFKFSSFKSTFEPFLRLLALEKRQKNKK